MGVKGWGKWEFDRYFLKAIKRVFGVLKLNITFKMYMVCKFEIGFD